MCGRFSMSNYSDFNERFEIGPPPGARPRYNIAPSQDILAIVGGDSPRAVYFKWGLIPFWAKESFKGLINARAETVDKKPSFRHSFRGKRCLIPADGFYEWAGEAGKKTPYRIVLKDNGMFAFAGLWDVWTSREGKTINTCTIITTEANTLIEPIHNRMPVILRREEEGIWLRKDIDAPELKKLLKPYPSEGMESFQVSTKINNFRNDIPEVLNPL
ncbi:MAG: SOS response-associated peptidase [Clostridia bacterium]|nr:SOS response-associated peptidase [Clostridia bacterium]